MSPIFKPAARLSVSLITSALLLAACGGGSGNPSTDSNILAVSGASVSFGTEDRLPISISVTQNAEGAPAFAPDMGQPIGPVHQFGPVGLTSPGMVVNVPYQSQLLTAGSEPQLYMAQPGGEWVHISDAQQIESNGQAMLQAQVPELGYAVVVQSAETKAMVATMSLNRAPRIANVQASLRVQSASPALAIVSANNGKLTDIYRVSAPTRVEYLLTASFPSTCAPRINLIGSHTAIVGGQPVISNRVLASRSFGSGLSSASFSIPHQINAEHNGSLTVYSQITCLSQTAITTLVGGASMHGFVVNMPAGAGLPAITRSPVDASTTLGGSASFNVQATGVQTYQWQRSLDGIVYQNVVGATRSSVAVSAILAEQGTFWRAALTNAAGTSYSSPARLNIGGSAVAPQIAQQPKSLAVSEGLNAQFIVVAQGIPVPTIQWQTRTFDASNTQTGWVDIAGATFHSYLTPPVGRANNQRQYRAIVRNSLGAIATDAATLTVQGAPSAPVMVEQPAFVTVTEGGTANFAVNASGTNLSYQWFKDGVELTGYNSPSISLPTTAADAGKDIGIRVRVSNDGGSVTSDAAVLTVLPVNTGTVSSQINATQGGVIALSDRSAVLEVPPGAVSGTQTLSLKSHSPAAYNVPADVYPIGQTLEISPANTTFNQAASVSVEVPEDERDGYSLAVIEVQPNQASISSFMAQAQIASVEATYSCLSKQAIVGKRAYVSRSKGGAFQLAQVPAISCAINNASQPAAVAKFLGKVPSDTFEACGSDSDFNFGNNARNGPYNIDLYEGQLINRHVACGRFTEENLSVDMPDKDGQGKATIRRNAALMDIDVRWSIYGKSGTSAPKKLHLKISNIVHTITPDWADPSAPLPEIQMLPTLNCSGGVGYPLVTCAQPKPLRINANSSAVYTMDIPISWSLSERAWAEFEPVFVLRYRTDGKTPGNNSTQPVDGNTNHTLNVKMRCDAGLAVANSNGCVFVDAAPVYVLRASDEGVKEAAEHIREAYGIADRDLRPDGMWKIKEGTRASPHFEVLGNGLKRAANEHVKNMNRAAACHRADSIIRTVMPRKASSSCVGNEAACSCDEFPFASTWNGAYLMTNRASAKVINAAQNSRAGAEVARMFTLQRVLDLTEYPSGNTFDPKDLRPMGDEFWVHID